MFLPHIPTVFGCYGPCGMTLSFARYVITPDSTPTCSVDGPCPQQHPPAPVTLLPPPHPSTPPLGTPSPDSLASTAPRAFSCETIAEAQKRRRREKDTSKDHALRGSILAARQRGSLGSEPSHNQQTLLQQTSTVSTFCNRPVTSASPSTFILSAVRGSLAEPTLATSPVLSCRTCPRRRVCPIHKII